MLFERFTEAEKRALQLKKVHTQRGTIGGNPSTNVYELVNRLRAYNSAAARRSY